MSLTRDAADFDSFTIDLIDNLLIKLEIYRKQKEATIQAGAVDYTIRCCQAIIAEGIYKERTEWTNKLIDGVKK